MVEVVLVECQRGQGALRSQALQVWSKSGELLAEHDHIHPDPIYAACRLRDDEKWLAAQAPQAPEAINSESQEVA